MYARRGVMHLRLRGTYLAIDAEALHITLQLGRTSEMAEKNIARIIITELQRIGQQLPQ